MADRGCKGAMCVVVSHLREAQRGDDGAHPEKWGSGNNLVSLTSLAFSTESRGVERIHRRGGRRQRWRSAGWGSRARAQCCSCRSPRSQDSEPCRSQESRTCLLRQYEALGRVRIAPFSTLQAAPAAAVPLGTDASGAQANRMLPGGQARAGGVLAAGEGGEGGLPHLLSLIHI